MAGRIGYRRPFDQGRDIVPSAVGALIVATVVPAAFVEVEPADNRLLAIDHDEFLMVGRGPQARRRRRFPGPGLLRSEEHTSELQSLMRIPYADFCFKKK